MSTPTANEQLSETELEPTPPEVKRYQREKLILRILSVFAGLGVLVGFVFAMPILDDVLTLILSENNWLRLLGTAILLGLVNELIALPIDFYSGYVLEHRYQLSTQTFRAWVWKRLKSYQVGGALGIPILLGLYALIWNTGSYWWLWTAGVWLLLTLVLGQLLPILVLPVFYKLTPLEDADLQARLEKLAAGTGLTLDGVFRWDLSKETRKANAALTGLGRSRRVLLADTLLDSFTPDEIEVVFAHEVGHHVYKHLPKLIGWRVLTSLVGFWLVDVVLGFFYPNFSQRYDTLPILLLVLTLFGMALAPLQNVVSRIFERQCDRYALTRTGKKTAYKSAFVKLARLNKSDAEPHPVVVWFLHDHPPIRERIAMADAVLTDSGS